MIDYQSQPQSHHQSQQPIMIQNSQQQEYVIPYKMHKSTSMKCEQKYIQLQQRFALHTENHESFCRELLFLN